MLLLHTLQRLGRIPDIYFEKGVITELHSIRNVSTMFCHSFLKFYNTWKGQKNTFLCSYKTLILISSFRQWTLQTFSLHNWPPLGRSMNYAHLIWLLCENLHGSVQRQTKGGGGFFNREICCCNMWHSSSRSLLYASARHFAGHGTSFKAMSVRNERQRFSGHTHTHT